jgi:putative FmdB family regulatory protein
MLIRFSGNAARAGEEDPIDFVNSGYKPHIGLAFRAIQALDYMDAAGIDARAAWAVKAVETPRTVPCTMPLYEYEVCDGDCKICGGKFVLRRPVSAPELKTCPLCKKPVRKVISNFNTPKLLKPVSIADAKKAGFTVLKRLGKGEYEKQ